MTSALVVGSIIGSGIFLLPVSLVPLGINSVIGWGVSGVGALAIAHSLARISREGAGIQTYIEQSFGSTVGYLVTFSFWCSNWAANAALALQRLRHSHGLTPDCRQSGSSSQLLLQASSCSRS
jgi:APA family basic amino acid/polyamine antiporter